MRLSFLPFVFVSFGHFNDKTIYTNYNLITNFCQIFGDFFVITFFTSKFSHNIKIYGLLKCIIIKITLSLAFINKNRNVILGVEKHFIFFVKSWKLEN